MGRQKNIPKKHDVGADCKYLDYIPAVKRRKRNYENHFDKFINVSCPTDISTQFYLGQLLLGTTNNVFPQEYKNVKISFKFAENNKVASNKTEDDNVDAILINCDKNLVVVKSHGDTNFIKELVSHKLFAFDFTHENEDIYLKIYFRSLPLQKFYPKLAKSVKTLFSLFFSDYFVTKDHSLTNSTKSISRGSEEVKKLYEKLTEQRKMQPNVSNQDFQHPSLKPTLRPYQEMSVQWMLKRERIEVDTTDILHPLYVPIKLKSGVEIYFDQYTGFVTSEKPIVAPTSKGGILADEMGLGKTVELLACILLNPKEESEQESDNEDIISPKRRKTTYRIEDSDEDFDLINIPSKKEHTTRQRNRRKVQNSSQINYVDESKEVKIREDFVKSSINKSANKIALELWYQSVLADMSTIKQGCIEDPNRIVVQCICGSTSENDSIKCSNCSKYQHKECFGYKVKLGKYMCPQCWMDEPLVDSKATLIVTPTTLKTQWCDEIHKHVEGNFKVLQYKGCSATPVYPTDLKNYDIILTTYNVLQNELRLTEHTQVFNLRKERKYSAPGSPLTRVKWWRLCLDEAQTVETPGRMVSEMARKINAVHRWAITGTPISKNLSDLYGLIDYLQITPYNDETTWKKILYEPYLTGDEEPLLNFLSQVLWRTAKNDVNDQINIPKQTYLEHALEFSAVEKYFYKREHELICSDFLSKVKKFDLSLYLENLDKGTLKKLMTPLLTLRHACTHPNTVRGRYLATKKQVKSMKELLNALILKNTNDSEDCLRLIISSLNGLSGVHLLMNNDQEAINSYRQVLQLVADYSGERGETKLNIDKPQVIHTLYNLAEILDFHPPDQPTLRDENLRKDCAELEKKYMEKFVGESTSAFESFSTLMVNVEKMQNRFILKEGQWYSDGLNWAWINDHFKELQSKVQTACENANVKNSLWDANERTTLQLIYKWDDDLSVLRSKLFEVIENLYDCQIETVNKIVVKEKLVTTAMNCHLRPQKKGKQPAKCPICIANDHLKKYEGILFGMVKREKTFEEMSLTGSWKPTLPELVLRALLAVLKSKNSKNEFIKDGELHLTIIDNLKKEFKELRRLWTFLDQQICAKDELDICKVRFQLKTDNEKEKVNKALKNLNYNSENNSETINLLSIHELDYQKSLLENDTKQNSVKLEKLLGTQSYLETLRKQQYEGQSPDPCPICKNTLEQHWSILSCGHSYCLECIQVLLEQTAGDHIQCSVCRNRQKYQDISYIKAGNAVSDDDTKKIEGNYSTKIEGIIKLLLDLKNDNPSVKVLLFSSWVTVLKCLQEALEKNSISCKLALSANMDVRITSFKNLKDIMVLLLPIHLGSKGLNLIEATQVILVEPLLNPADELQAIGRVNRIGQTKPTFVHKFYITNTIEENIHQATTSHVENWEKSRVTLQHLVDLFYCEFPVEINEQPAETEEDNNRTTVDEEITGPIEKTTVEDGDGIVVNDNVDHLAPSTSLIEQPQSKNIDENELPESSLITNNST